MGERYTDKAVKILAVNELLDSRNAILMKQAFGTAAGLLLGAFFFGKKGALMGSLAGAVLSYEPLVNYQGILRKIKNLADDDKSVVAGLLQQVVGSDELEKLALFSENSENARAIFFTLQEYLNAKNL